MYIAMQNCIRATEVRKVRGRGRSTGGLVPFRCLEGGEDKEAEAERKGGE